MRACKHESATAGAYTVLGYRHDGLGAEPNLLLISPSSLDWDEYTPDAGNLSADARACRLPFCGSLALSDPGTP
jgi:hypothetical protein